MIKSHLAEDPLESNGPNRCRMAQVRLLPCYHTRKHAILQLSLSRASAHATIHQRMVRRARRDTRVAHTNMEYAYVHIIFVSTPASPLLLTYGAEIMLGNHAGKPDDRHRVAKRHPCRRQSWPTAADCANNASLEIPSPNRLGSHAGRPSCSLQLCYSCSRQCLATPF